jgi:hypothetical protein
MCKEVHLLHQFCTQCYQSQQIPANRVIQPRYVQQNHRIAGAGAVERARRQQRQLRAHTGGGARRKGARLKGTGKGSVCDFRTPPEPESDSKLTCDLLTSHLEFNFAIFSHA